MNLVSVEIVFAPSPQIQTVIQINVEPGIRIIEAIKQSKILEHHKEIDLTINKVGIFGRLMPLDTQLTGTERIEIYRPLKIDPKSARRKKANEKNTVSHSN